MHRNVGKFKPDSSPNRLFIIDTFEADLQKVHLFRTAEIGKSQKSQNTPPSSLMSHNAPFIT